MDSWSGPLSLSCLRNDYLTKLRNKTSAELRTLRACPAEAIGVPASVDWVGCLRLSSIMLGPKQVHTLTPFDLSPRPPTYPLSFP